MKNKFHYIIFAVGFSKIEKESRSVNTCKDCRFFEKHLKRHHDYDTCEDTFIETDFGECLSNTIIYADPDDWRYIDKNDNPLPLRTDALYYQDGEDYSAFHLVGKDFGCIHFQEKDSQSDEKSGNPPTN